ncbi:oxidoreductase [Acerihabitans arboris]|uniref:SDR family NAD(P)-dependent oxidoreductase n=1 Tax=Acerihabitans arboris TaxID=2691583 RepID=A0A845SB28_9GAMM|nr:oxidoreductase [Acerihabitans arboris]NDL62023.1 SDR family NAD(P)-dependent oxidoreductase [Acerihabitans arboris]
MSTWLITGCSTGLGRYLAQAVLERGWNAVVTARDPVKVQDIVTSYPDTALAVALDVTDSTQIAEVVRQAEARFGAVDVLVNNAGHGYRAAVEEGDEADVDELFATNFFGPVKMIKAILRGMRSRRNGIIVNVSSIAGRGAEPGSGYYAATKFALEGMSDALRKEIAPLGIKVVVVEPGAFRTDFAGRSLQQSKNVITDYANTAGLRRKEKDESHGKQPGDSARGAQVIIKAVEAADAPFRLLLGSDAVKYVRSQLETQLTEVNAWEKISVTTDFPS